ncbi:class I SAM-dependent methyltransferase [Shimia thalassica]|uniref:class I SAM-dependent methyltransferase n=1 Tax=Shimia thalassica TaxID=1715693 RepID=UPI0027372112|nr:class I SAM-dependent methyltransferase [Shimia thalassica]MDP2578633.1 class I SAM-dependent methyltransferase [Shimia thalassica]
MTEIVDILQERKELPLFLERDGLVGIELGVAGGWYSKRLNESGLFSELYGVDLYGDHHDTKEYIEALHNVGLREKYWLLRMSFEDALDVFPDEYFDFVYIDGYAHTGEERGKTMFDWYNKVKVGGMIAGHDYHKKWPLVKISVNTLADTLGQPVMRTTMSKNRDPQDKFPSWALFKERAEAPEYPDSLRSLPKRLRG